MADPIKELAPTSNDRKDYSFPSEIAEIDHTVTFQIYETTQLSRSESTKKVLLGSITLPLPANLGTNYDMHYNSENLGALGQTLIDSLGTGAGAKNASSMGTDVLNGLASPQALGTAGVIGAVGGGIGKIVSGALLGIGSTDANLREIVVADSQNAVDSFLGRRVFGSILGQSGLAINPHKVLLFTGVDFREHEFTYQFVPQSYREAETLTKIIRKFKYHGSPMYSSANLDIATKKPLPGTSPKLTDSSLQFKKYAGEDTLSTSTGKHFFQYPDWFDISFSHPEHLFTMSPSVLTSINVDYHPANIPSYARGPNDMRTPTQINIKLRFKETEIVTKETVGSDFSKPGR